MSLKRGRRRWGDGKQTLKMAENALKQDPAADPLVLLLTEAWLHACERGGLFPGDLNKSCYKGGPVFSLVKWMEASFCSRS